MTLPEECRLPSRARHHVSVGIAERSCMTRHFPIIGSCVGEYSRNTNQAAEWESAMASDLYVARPARCLQNRVQHIPAHPRNDQQETKESPAFAGVSAELRSFEANSEY